MRLAYADPPYPGHARRYREKTEVDHAALIASLTEYDGWALSTSSPSLRWLLPLCPERTRVAAWTKTNFSVFPGVRPAYSWEPVIFWGGRTPHDITRDSFVSPRREGLKPRKTGAILGAKPPEFCRWVLDLLGYQEGDELVDLFPGTGVMGRVVAQGVLSL